jgi:hypothetical protein
MPSQPIVNYAGVSTGQGWRKSVRQLIYISSVNPAVPIDADEILAGSRRRNTALGITGLLYHDGKRFLQAIEGEDAAIADLYGRLQGDPRHRAIVILSDRQVDAREFGAWAMAHRQPGDGEGFVAEVERLVAGATPAVRATFESFARLRRAA